MFCILVVDLIRAPRSDLFNVVVLRWRSRVLRLRVEDRVVGWRPSGAAWVIGGEGGERPSEAGAGRVLRGVVVGGEHWRGGLCGDSPASQIITIKISFSLSLSLSQASPRPTQLKCTLIQRYEICTFVN